MTVVWRAADVAPSERVDSFVHVVSEFVVPYGSPGGIVLESSDQVRSAEVGTMRIMTMDMTRVRMTRSTSEIRSSDPELCKIDVVENGRFALDQSDRQTQLHSGTFTFVDLSRPHAVAARRASMTVVMFPRALLALRDKDISELAGATFDGTQPGGALVTSVIQEMVRRLHTYAGQGSARIAASVLDLISATLATRLNRVHLVSPDSRQRALVLRIRAFIEDNLANPELSPATIAARHHISVRQLHKLFENEETTVAGLVRARRLAHCSRDLLDPTQATRPIGAIAAGWGLPDPAYFSRTFSATYGIPPAEYRRTAALAR